MSSGPVTKRKAVGRLYSLSYDIKKSGGASTTTRLKHEVKPKKMIAGFLDPGCEHEWIQLENHLQTLASEGKTIYQCHMCDEVTNTYAWQKPCA